MAAQLARRMSKPNRARTTPTMLTRSAPCSRYLYARDPARQEHQRPHGEHRRGQPSVRTRRQSRQHGPAVPDQIQADDRNREGIRVHRTAGPQPDHPRQRRPERKQHRGRHGRRQTDVDYAGRHPNSEPAPHSAAAARVDQSCPRRCAASSPRTRRFEEP